MSKILLLLWKNVIIQFRKKSVTCCEIITPLLFVVLCILVRAKVKSDKTERQFTTKYYPAPVIPSIDIDKNRTSLTYYPNSPLTQRIMANLKVLPETSGPLQLKGFTSEDEMVKAYLRHPAVFYAGVIFNVVPTATSLPSAVKVTIRQAWGLREEWFTRDRFIGQRAHKQIDGDYSTTGFTMLQRAIGESIIGMLNASYNRSLYSVFEYRLPAVTATPDSVLLTLGSLFPISIMMSFLLHVAQTTKNIVTEKERKLKETMKLMGLDICSYWTSWFLTVFLYMAMIVLLYVVLLCLPLTANGAVLPKTSILVFFLFLLSYCMAMIAFCCMVSAFIQKGSYAVCLTTILFLGLYLPYSFLINQYHYLSRTQKALVCLSFNVALCFGTNILVQFEETEVGVSLSNINKTPFVDDNFTLLDAIIMLLVDAVLYMIIAWYVDNINPGEFGIAQPLYFPCMPSYWCGESEEDMSRVGAETSNSQNFFEREPQGLNCGIAINKLTKVFGSGAKAKTAVAGVSLNLYEDQITVLLGHNGAGKTTTMSMLTGFIPPTSGTAKVNGYDIRTQINMVRKTLGLCPQHDVLFDGLTVEEHLVFFARLKGCSGSQVTANVNTILAAVGLDFKRSSQASTMSGGQKRKLSVGIALIGGSKIVILDEPSSGMDPASRRHIWGLLQSYRPGRTTLLTTHFMDEADALGDRIAIMAEGVVKCCGTSMFLKKIYGTGYRLVIVIEPECDVDDVTELVTRCVEGARLDSHAGMELQYILPEEQSASYPELFHKLDHKRKRLNIGSYGTTATTMEEVFLNVGKKAEQEAAGTDELPQQDITTGKHNFGYGTLVEESGDDFLAFNKNYTKLTGASLAVSRFKAMTMKKRLYSQRNIIFTLCQFILSAALLNAALLLDVEPPEGEEPPVTLILDNYPPTKVAYTADKNATTNVPFTSIYPSLISKQHEKVKIDRDNYADVADYYLTEEKALGLRTYKEAFVIGGQLMADVTGEVLFVAHFNKETFHGQGISVAYIMNTMLKAFVGRGYSIEFTNFPMPKPVGAESPGGDEDKLASSVRIYTVVVISFVMAGYVHFLIKERVTGAKHLQMVSGVGPAMYWLANLFWDMLLYLLFCLLIVPAFYFTKADSYKANMSLVFLVLLLNGWSMIPAMYLIQLIFSSPASGMGFVILINLLTGLSASTLLTIMEAVAKFRPSYQSVADAVEQLLIGLIPLYDTGQCLYNINTNHRLLKKCALANCDKPTAIIPCCPALCKMGFVCAEYVDNYLEWKKPGLRRYTLALAVQGVVFLLLLFIFEYRLYRRCSYAVPSLPHQPRRNSHEDSDVAEERRRLLGKSYDEVEDSLVLQNVYKRYGGFVAVDHITFGIREGTCFGLLGQNGAGKTTTFKMITGDVMLSGGRAVCLGYDIRTQITKVQENLGYCPQFDALIDQMTARETLAMFALLRGVPQSAIPNVVNKLIEIMMLEKHADKETSTYSGGNKRKLSTALALIGDPPFIMLDEPTTGMDPAARRQLWTVLSRVRDSGRTLVLTSHSMEECEALCTKIAIMVNGQFMCLGTPQHLKTKFAQGYTIIVRVDEDISRQMLEYLNRAFHKVEPVPDQEGYLRYHIKDKGVKLANLFELMEASKADLNVLDYSVHQTTLEQVFLSFTSVQQAMTQTSLLEKIFSRFS